MMKLPEIIRKSLPEKVLKKVLDDNIHPAGSEFSTLFVDYIKDSYSLEYEGELVEKIDDLINRAVESIISDWKDRDLNFSAEKKELCGWCEKPFEDPPTEYYGRFYHPDCLERAKPFFKQYSDAKPGTYHGD